MFTAHFSNGSRLISSFCCIGLMDFVIINTAIYSIIISMLVDGWLISVGKFIMRRSFYAAITRTPDKMENALIRHAQAPEHKQISAFMRVLYKLYQNEVQALICCTKQATRFYEPLGTSDENTDFSHRAFIAGRWGT